MDSLGVAHERGICLLTVRAIVTAADVTVGGGADSAVCESGTDGERGLVRRRMEVIAEDDSEHVLGRRRCDSGETAVSMGFTTRAAITVCRTAAQHQAS